MLFRCHYDCRSRPSPFKGYPHFGMKEAMDAAGLPEPSAEAREHSRRLQSRISDAIAAAGGAIRFAEFMEMALYSPGMGYYSAGSRKFGSGGDFTTAPELSPLFSASSRSAAGRERLPWRYCAPWIHAASCRDGTGYWRSAQISRIDSNGSWPSHCRRWSTGSDGWMSCPRTWKA